MKCDKFEDIYFVIDHFCQEKLDIRTLMDKFADRISMREIEELRVSKREEIMGVLKKQMDATMSHKGNQFPRLKFISNFQLYHGLAKFYTNMRSETSLDIDPQDLITQTLEKFDQDLMSIFDCDPSWPCCLYDYTNKNLCPKFIVMRVQQPLDTFVIDDYFFTSDKAKEADQLREVFIKNEDYSFNQPEVPFSELIIQRDKHICQDLNYPSFVPYFKKRFSAQDNNLFLNENLHFDIDDLMDAKTKMLEFVKSVCKPLSDEIFDAVEKFQRRASMAMLKKEVEKVTKLGRIDE